MGEPEKPKIEDLAAEVALWKTFRDLRRAKGFEIAGLWGKLAIELEQGLHSPGAKMSLQRYVRQGASSKCLHFSYGYSDPRHLWRSYGQKLWVTQATVKEPLAISKTPPGRLRSCIRMSFHWEAAPRVTNLPSLAEFPSPPWLLSLNFTSS